MSLSLPAAKSSIFTRFWQLPTLVVTRLTLESYLKSNWFWGEVVVVLAWFAALFFPYPANMAYFFGVGGSGLYAVAILGAAALVRHSVGARSYIVLARLSSRASYSRGLILATAILRLPLFIMLLILALLLQRVTNPEAGALAVGTIGVLANCFLLSALTVTLSSPMATRLTRIIFLGWLVAAFTPLDQIVGFLTILRLPLLPLAASFALGETGNFEWFSVVGLILQAGYIIGLTFLAGFWLERRELLLQ